jgi:hypothetical protein
MTSGEVTHHMPKLEKMELRETAKENARLLRRDPHVRPHECQAERIHPMCCSDAESGANLPDGAFERPKE